MGESKTIRVTPNLKACLLLLNKAVKTLPPGGNKRQAQAALSYLARTFQGRPQPLRGAGCSLDTGIIK